MSQAEASRVFRVGQSTVKRYVSQYRHRGNLTPKTSPGRTPTFGPDQLHQLRKQVEDWPDATLAEHVRLWSRTQHTVVSMSTMSRALRSVGWGRARNH